MKIISHISNDIINFYNKQNYSDDYQYRQIKYLKFLEVDKGYLIYNLFTNELILINDLEYNNLINNTLKENNFFLYHFLIRHWYLIPKDLNEKTLIYLYRNIKNNGPIIDNHINTFIILTTSDCNARCYYCFELGAKRINMTKETALDVAKFIQRKANLDLPVRISWFGGEPLFNSEVIDIIIGYFKENNIKYVSTMVTNGYLFDEELIFKAKNFWNLANVQITLDGTEEKYNKIKSYIYKNEENAFNRVLNNIKTLIKNKIYVSLRCNTSKNNYNDLYNLIDVIDKEIGGNQKYLLMYFAVLFEEAKQQFYMDFPQEEREFIYNKMYELENYAKEKGLFKDYDVTVKDMGGVKTSHCMADNCNTTLISPEGNLGSCEHFIDSDFFGSIYDEYYNLGRDYSNLYKWKEKSTDLPECDNCYYYPKCFRLKNCEPDDIFPVICDKYYKKIEPAMLNSYNKYKEENNENL